MNLSGLAKARSVPYSTVRKYISALIERGYISPDVTSHSITLHDNDVEVFDKLLLLIRSGMSFKAALNQLGKTSDDSGNDAVEYLRRLEGKIDSLEEENRKLRELVQVYLSKVDDLQKQLMPPKKKGWLQDVFFWRKERRKNEKI